MSSTQAIEQQLQAVQEQFEAVSAALAQGNTEQLGVGSERLHHLAVAILQAIDSLPPQAVRASEWRERLQQMARSMTDLRVHIMRRAAHVDQAVAILMPESAADPTYREGNTPYGGVARTSGQLRSVSA